MKIYETKNGNDSLSSAQSVDCGHSLGAGFTSLTRYVLGRRHEKFVRPFKPILPYEIEPQGL